jgi:hypothetical protein
MTVHAMELNDPGSLFQHPLWLEARRLFEAFYSIATPQDAIWLDRLLLTREAFTRAAGLPRLVISTPEGRDLERACHEAEMKFMQARDEVRGCPRFVFWMIVRPPPRLASRHSEAAVRSGPLPHV